MNKSWFKELSVYQIWPRSFCDSNGDGIGDLKGVLSKLDYIKSLGCDAIWFSPLYPSPQKDYGYDISNYMDINPEYGTLSDFKILLKEAHSKGIKVIMDLVINHTSDQHEWFKKSCAGDPKYKDYYIWRPGKGKNQKKPPNNWMSTFPGDGWEYSKERNEYYLHLFAVEQPDLNHDNPNVRAEIKKIMEFWLNMGVDGFREDVITYISKREGLPNGKRIPIMRGVEHYSPGPNIHKYLLEYRNVVKHYDAFQVGEAPMMTPKKALKYIEENDKQQLDMIFYFEHMEGDCIKVSYLKTRFNLRKLKKIYAKWQHSLYNRAWNTNFLENHDVPRIISRYGNEEKREESGKALATMYTLLSGTHFIYQGQEIGMTNYPFKNWNDFVDVATFNVKELMEKTHLFSKKSIFKRSKYAARDNARTCMQWSSDKNAGFTDGTPWYHINPNYKEVNVSDSIKRENSLLNYYKRLLELRRNYKDEIIYGEFEDLMPKNKYIFMYKKTSVNGSNIYVICNISDKQINSNRIKKLLPTNVELLLSTNNRPIMDIIDEYESFVYYQKN